MTTTSHITTLTGPRITAEVHKPVELGTIGYLIGWGECDGADGVAGFWPTPLTETDGGVVGVVSVGQRQSHNGVVRWDEPHLRQLGRAQVVGSLVHIRADHERGIDYDTWRYQIRMLDETGGAFAAAAALDS